MSDDSSIIKDNNESLFLQTNTKKQQDKENLLHINIINNSTPKLNDNSNILEEVSAIDSQISKTPETKVRVSSSKAKKVRSRQSGVGSLKEISSSVKTELEESKTSVPPSSRRKTRSSLANLTPKATSRKSEFLPSTPKTRKSSVNSVLSRRSTTPQNKSLNTELDAFNKELEACKSRLKKTLLEKETVENRLKYELDEKRNENSYLQAELNKLKSELQKCNIYFNGTKFNCNFPLIS